MSEPPPIDPHLLYEMRLKVSKSFAASYVHNTRNLEAHWYEPWQLVLTYLIRDRPDLFINPQFPVYHIDGEGDKHIRKQGQNLDFPDKINVKDKLEDHFKGPGIPKATRKAIDKPLLPKHPPDPPKILDGLNEPADANTSIATIAAPRKFTSTTVPDFCIFHHGTIPSKLKTKDLRRFTALGGLQVIHTCCPLIMENKRSPTRKTRGQDFDYDVSSLISEALDGLYSQCGLYFKMFSRASSVIVIAAAGAHWQYRVVHFSEFEPEKDSGRKRIGVKGKEEAPAPEEVPSDPLDVFKLHPEWSEYLELGTDPSKDALQKMRDLLNKCKPILQPPV